MTNARATDAATEPNIVTSSYDSPVGRLRLVADAQSDSLLAVLWPSDTDRVRFAVDPAPGASPVLDRAGAQLDEYFAGQRRDFDLRLDPRGTEFQQQVWWSLADIPFGETSTYAKQAANLGRPRAVRAVGSANGRNPLSVVLPCHRIVGSDGKLTGFAGGLEAKRWLLDHERSVAAAAAAGAKHD